METYQAEELHAGDIILNNKSKYQGVLGTVLDGNIWLTEEADLIEEVDFGTRKNLLNENTIQLKKFELIRKAGKEVNET